MLAAVSQLLMTPPEVTTHGFHFSCSYFRLLIHHGEDGNAAEPPGCLDHRCEGVQGHSNALGLLKEAGANTN